MWCGVWWAGLFRGFHVDGCRWVFEGGVGVFLRGFKGVFLGVERVI